MATQTTNLNLTKPAESEAYSVPIVNANMDKIDEFAGGFGQFTYVYKGGLGHVTGETRLDKFKRAYQANAFPIGKPFFGYISAGSMLLVMGYLYMSSDQLYGCGYIASYDGATLIRVQADSFFDFESTGRAFTITRTENNYVSATELARCSAYKKAGILFLVFNCSLSGAGGMTDFVEIGTISGWNAPTSVFATIMPQNAEAKPINLQVQPNGSIRIYGSQGTAYSFYRGTVSIAANG